MRVHYIIIYIAALMSVACSSESTLEEIKPIAPIGNDPIAFTGIDEAAMTRANDMPSNMLRSGFVVSTYKHFGASDWSDQLHTVMPRYLVEYKENRDDWNGVVISNWNYVNINNLYTGNRQEEKFWDYSGFPYRFHAVAPANGNSISKDQIKTLCNNELFINAPYKAQTFTAPAVVSPSGSESPSITPTNQVAEPYLVAQFSRNNNGEDLDIIKNIVFNKDSYTKNRRVWLPFHHLNSKVRFGVFTRSLSQTAQHDYISDLVITAEKLATSATSYKAYGQDSWISNYGFSGFQGITVEDNQTIFTFNPSVPSSGSGSPNDTYRSYANNDLSLHQSRSSAYWLECPDGIMQIPQNGVKLHVSLKVCHEDGTVDFDFYDYEVEVSPGSSVDPTHWIAGCIHTYYLCLELDGEGLPIIEFTATLTPWEDITGTLSTDLEQ